MIRSSKTKVEPSHVGSEPTAGQLSTHSLRCCSGFPDHPGLHHQTSQSPTRCHLLFTVTTEHLECEVLRRHEAMQRASRWRQEMWRPWGDGCPSAFEQWAIYPMGFLQAAVLTDLCQLSSRAGPHLEYSMRGGQGSPRSTSTGCNRPAL